MKTSRKLLALWAVCVLFALHAPATVLYVDLNNPNPTPPYTNWPTAATNIQDAIDAASAGDTVLVTNGVYATGGRTVNGYTLTNRVVVDKPITVQSINGSSMTFIKGNRPIGTNAVRCVYLTNNATLNGFTLTNGATLSTGDMTNEQSGAGVWCNSTNCMLLNCLVVSNTAQSYGGATFRGALSSCSIDSNSSNSRGGAGAYQSVLTNCFIIRNSSIDGPGGGVLNCVLYNSSIVSNFAVFPNGAGGGAAFSTLNNSKIAFNTGLGPGSAGIFCNFNNCLISSNTSSTSYSQCEGNGSALNNCTIVGNMNGYGLGYCSATNCIVYFNLVNSYGGHEKNCCTTPLPSGSGNITNEPLFVNIAAGDFHLQSNSPCINAGNNGFVTVPNDLAGNPRIVGGTVDIGAYEYQTPASVLSYAWAQQYGLPTDGSADSADTDGDGLNNWAEWKAGTNPTNAASVLQLTSPSISVSGVTVTWQSVSGINYYLQRSLALPGFTPVQSNLIGQAGTTSYLDASATNGGPYFYRVGVQ